MYTEKSKKTHYEGEILRLGTRFDSLPQSRRTRSVVVVIVGCRQWGNAAAWRRRRELPLEHWRLGQLRRWQRSRGRCSEILGGQLALEGRGYFDHFGRGDKGRLPLTPTVSAVGANSGADGGRFFHVIRSVAVLEGSAGRHNSHFAAGAE